MRYQERSILRWCLWTSFGLIIFYAEIVVIEAVWPSTITKIILAIATAVFAVIFVFIAAILQDRVRHCCIFDSTADKNSRNVHSKSFFHKLKHAFAARDADLKEICAFQIAQLEDPDTFLRYNKNYNDFKEYQGRKKNIPGFRKDGATIPFCTKK
ncbi:hypothetical protein M3Y98_00803500 [Aphelenchoides besseyi]|nr:hypothetical protein M3Y98_00803500 [Aphelenchoides besseyi]